MDSKDLRVGNYIYDRFELIAMIEEIRQHSVKLSSIHDGGYKFESYSIEEVRPIQLNEDWLLKFGFEKLQYYYSLNGFDCDLQQWIGFKNMTTMVPIQYVHQLQNLFWCLTGKELTFI